MSFVSPVSVSPYHHLCAIIPYTHTYSHTYDSCKAQLQSTTIRYGSTTSLCLHYSSIHHNRIIVIPTANGSTCITIDFYFSHNQLQLQRGCYVKNIRFQGVRNQNQVLRPRMLQTTANRTRSSGNVEEAIQHRQQRPIFHHQVHPHMQPNAAATRHHHDSLNFHQQQQRRRMHQVLRENAGHTGQVQHVLRQRPAQMSNQVYAEDASSMSNHAAANGHRRRLNNPHWNRSFGPSKFD